MSEPQEYDCEEGVCPNCLDVCMEHVAFEVRPDGTEVTTSRCPACEMVYELSVPSAGNALIIPPYDALASS